MFSHLAAVTDPDPLDPAMAALLADPRVALRPPNGGMAMADYRRRLDRPMAAVIGPVMTSVQTVRGVDDRGVDLRRYRAVADPRGTILFIHGGGFVAGSLDTHDALCRTLAVESGAEVVAVDYRLAPEAPAPAALDDCRAALRWIAQNSMSVKLAICGDSVGGYLATWTALGARRDGVDVAALGLLYPVVAPDCGTPSWRHLGTGHMLTIDWMRWAWASYLGDSDPAQASLLRANLRGLPPTRIVTAAYDPLCDEGEALAETIRSAGASATVVRYAGMIHGFASLPMLTPAADLAIADLARHCRVNIGVD